MGDPRRRGAAAGGRLLRPGREPHRPDHVGRPRRPGAAVRAAADLGRRRLPPEARAPRPRRASAEGSVRARARLPARAPEPPERLSAARRRSATGRTTCPTQTSEFLGREAQLAAIRDLLDATGVRLVTLTGPGGIGKTRLALQAAADQIDRFEDGVYFVDLSPRATADAVFEGVVRTRRPDATRRRAAARGAAGAAARTAACCSLLDNFEQVMAAADGVAELLQQLPDAEGARDEPRGAAGCAASTSSRCRRCRCRAAPRER